jgi:hypothetical protein
MLAERGREESHNPTNIIKISKTQVFEPPIPPPLGDKNLLIKKKKKNQHTLLVLVAYFFVGKIPT